MKHQPRPASASVNETPYLLDPIDPIDPKRDALLVVDLQPDFMPGGALPVAGGDEIVAPIAALCARFATVVATQDFHPPGHISFASRHGVAPFTTVTLPGAAGGQVAWPEHCVAGTAGAALHPGLPADLLTLCLRKGTRRDVDSYSAFRENRDADGERMETGLGPLLRARGVRRVFLCGLAGDVCVADSAADAAAEGFAAVLLADLCRDVRPEAAAETRARLLAAGVSFADSAALLPRDSDSDDAGAPS